MNNQTVHIEGLLDHIIFHNEENGYAVFILLWESENGEEETTCTGYIPDIAHGIEVSLTGTWVNNPKYGTQFSVSDFEKKIPTNAAGIEKYLSSGVIKGIGARMAKRIVDKFGELSFDVIAESPERLATIKGITLEKAVQMSEAFHSQGEQRRAVLLLQDYGISPVFAMRIYKKYKAQTGAVVQYNPYKLAEDIDGIGFKMADDIARRIGIPFDSPFRVAAGLMYCLWEASGNGHVYLPKQTLISHAVQILNIPEEIIENTMRQMQIDRQIHSERSENDDTGESDTRVSLAHFYHAELNVARKLYDLANATSTRLKTGLEVDIENGESDADETPVDNLAEDSAKNLIKNLSQGQREAVEAAATNGVLIITGGPGTGKTTTINTLIGMFDRLSMKVELAAPTGRAAKRMTETTGKEAKTIHRLLESTQISEDSRRQAFQKDEKNPIEADVLIIDEASMVDILLMQSLLKAVSIGTRLIMVGDVDQLPSVGPGNVLKDIITSDCIKVARLTEIFRQAQESAIIMNAHRINQGKYPNLNDKNKESNDFFFLKRYRADEVIPTLLELVSKRLPTFLGEGANFHDIQVLTPMRKSALGVVQLNLALQNHLNPPSPTKKEREFRSTIFREGDKVMQIRNNYQMSWQMLNESGKRKDEGEGVFNGDCGIIKAIDEKNELVRVLFDDMRLVDYDYSQLDELELAYAITVHKSQGSEYKAVVMPIHSGPSLLFSRNLLYTAVTRAKKLCVIVGVPEAMNGMVDNNREVERYTGLARKLSGLNRLKPRLTSKQKA